MSDELNNDAIEHLYPEQQHSAEKVQQSNQQNTPQDSQKDNNMRILRERAEAAERRSQELERMVQMNMSQQHSTKLQIEDEADDIDISDDILVEGKHLKKYVKSLKQELKNNKKQFEDHNRQMAANQAEIMLKNKFTDFDTVVNKENIEKLAAKNPVLHRSLYANTDVYDFGYTAYEFIKNSGIIENQYQELDKRVEDNKNKPRSAANVSPQSSDTPLTRIGDYDRRVLSEDRKLQLRQQVEYAKSMKQ
jgi:hypothetical protein